MRTAEGGDAGDTQRVRRWSGFSARGKTIGLALGVLSVSAGVVFGSHHFVTHSSYFSLRTFRVSSLKHISQKMLIDRANVSLGHNLFALDTTAIRKRLLSEPWVKRAHVRLELPSTLVLDVVEQDAAFAVALGGLYLADKQGVVFKRAESTEAAHLPVLTGIERETYMTQSDRVRERIAEAVRVADAWARVEAEPLGEINFDGYVGYTVYSRSGDLVVRVGTADETLDQRMNRLATLRAALGKAQPKMIYLDNHARPDRVVVRLASSSSPRVQAEQRAD